MNTNSNLIYKHQKNKSNPVQGNINYYLSNDNQNSKISKLTINDFSNLNNKQFSKSLKRQISYDIYSKKQKANISYRNNNKDNVIIKQNSMDNIFFKLIENKIDILDNAFNTFTPSMKKSISLHKTKSNDNKIPKNKKKENINHIKTIQNIGKKKLIKRTNSDNSTYNTKISKTENTYNSNSGTNFSKNKITISQLKPKKLNKLKDETIITKENKAIISFNPKKNEKTKSVKQFKFDNKLSHFRNSIKSREIKSNISKNKKLNNHYIKTDENQKIEKKVKINETKKIESESDDSIIDNNLNDSEECPTKDLDEESSFISNNKINVNNRFLIKKKPLENKGLNHRIINNNNHSINFPIQISQKIKNDEILKDIDNLKIISDIINTKNIIENNINNNSIKNVIKKEFQFVEKGVNKMENKLNIESKYSNETNDEESINNINNIEFSKNEKKNIEKNEFIDDDEVNGNETYNLHNQINQFIPFKKPISNYKRNSLNTNTPNINENDSNSILKNSKKFFTYIPLFSKLIFPFCDLEIINTLTLINKKFNKSFIPIIYEKIKEKVILINKNDNKEIKNKIKKHVFKYSPSYKNIDLIQKIYYDNLYNCDSPYDFQIKKDLPRTFPENNLFNEGSKLYIKLYKILTSYSNYNNNIGYAQGLNLLTAHSIFFFDKDEEVFIFLDGMINRFNLEELIGVNNKLTNKLKKIGELIKIYSKKVNNFLEKNSLSHEFFTANWIVTLFSKSMNNENISLIWDYMIIFGWKFFYCFIIVVINFYQNDIISFDPDKISEFMKNLLFSNKFNINIESIINKTFIFMEKNNNNVL